MQKEYKTKTEYIDDVLSSWNVGSAYLNKCDEGHIIQWLVDNMRILIEEVKQLKEKQ